MRITVGSLIAAGPFAPRASVLGALGATAPQAWQQGARDALAVSAERGPFKGGVLHGASLLTAAEALHAAKHMSEPDKRDRHSER